METNEDLNDDVRNAVIAWRSGEFRKAGHELIDRIARLLDDIGSYKVTPAFQPSQLRKKLQPFEFPVKGKEGSELIKAATDLLLENSLFNGHPAFWGYITSSPAPIGMLADLLAAAVNSNCGAFILSPMATEIEKQTIQWLAQLIGYPVPCGGIMVSGGNMANFAGFLAARKAMADWDIRKEGLYPGKNALRMYASSETHTWIQKAADLFGMGIDAIRWVPVKKDLAMDTAALYVMLKEDIEKGLKPFLVVGTAGSVGTGVVDPLKEIAGLCKRYHCWFHIDGAYGAFAAALPENRDMYEGMADADSIAMDPHKWLYSPLEAGCCLVRQQSVLTDAFSFHPVYYNFDGEEEHPTNYYESGLQNSRGFRALKVWLSLQQAGSEGYISMIREDIRLAKFLFDTLAGYPDLERFSHHLSITTFRFRPAGMIPDDQNKEYLNRLNQALLNKLQSGGEVFPSNAVIDGNFVLRVCVVNFRTTLKDIAALPEIVIREGNLLHKQMQVEQPVKR